jgi:hypothetical protein
MKMHINHAIWLFLAAFHIPINFHTESQIARIAIIGISHGSKE